MIFEQQWSFYLELRPRVIADATNQPINQPSTNSQDNPRNAWLLPYCGRSALCCAKATTVSHASFRLCHVTKVWLAYFNSQQQLLIRKTHNKDSRKTHCVSHFLYRGWFLVYKSALSRLFVSGSKTKDDKKLNDSISGTLWTTGSPNKR